MLTTFTLLTIAGFCLRFTLSWALKQRFQLHLTVPQALAGIVLVLAGLPDWIKPLPYPFPLSFTFGALLPDFLSRRS